MHHIIDTNTGMTALEPRKWLRGVEKVGLLNLLWVPHYNRTPVIVLVIKQLFCLVHDGCLWLEELISITDMLIHRITRLPYTGENPAMIFGGKGGELVLVESMKEKFKLVKKPRGYASSSICDPTMKVAMQILTGKVMQKCHADEVPVPVIALAQQCAEGVQFNWLDYLHGEFLENCRKAQEKSKTFHYMWLLLSIVLVAWELPEESQFPSVMPDLPEAVKYASMWATKDTKRVWDNKIFWNLMEMNIKMAINYKLRILPTVYANLQSYAEFKADFHQISIKAQKDPAQKWYDLSYLATDDAIDAMLDKWPAECRTTTDLAMGGSKSATQKKKEEAKLKMV